MHKTQVVDTKVISDEAVAIRVRCCEDASTDSWHTLQITSETSDKDVKAWHDDRITAVQNKHAARNNVRQLLDGLKADVSGAADAPGIL